MDTNKKTTLKLTPQEVEKLVEFIRQSGRPQSIEALTRRYVELLKEKEATSRR